jgi:hypothetical protein
MFVVTIATITWHGVLFLSLQQRPQVAAACTWHVAELWMDVHTEKASAW